MKKFFKTLNSRLDKAYLYLIGLLLLQIIMGVLVGVIMYDSSQSYNGLRLSVELHLNFEEVTQFSLVFVAIAGLIVAKVNDIKGYTNMGIKRTTSIGLNICQSIIVSFVFVIGYILSFVVSRLLFIAIHSDVIIIDSLCFSLQLELFLENTMLLFLSGVAIYFAMCIAIKLFGMSRLIGLVGISSIILAFGVLFVLPLLISQDFQDFVYSIVGQIVTGLTFIVITFGGYALLEKYGEVGK